MKKIYKLIGVYGFVIVSIIMLRVMGVVDVDGYDVVLKWLNFGVLVYVIVAFGKKPIKNFLASQKEDLAGEIEGIETEKESTRQKIQEAQDALKESQTRFSELRDRIVQRGEKKKEQIIADAQQKSTLMLEGVQQKIARMATEAKASFSSEMIDTAIALVEQQLADIVTEEDNQKYVNRYMAHIAGE